MKHAVTIRGDSNDADYTEESCTVDLEENIFKGWGADFDNKAVTFKQALTALGQALKWFGIEHEHRSNWRDEERDSTLTPSRTMIFKKVVEILAIDIDPSFVYEAMWDFFPGSHDYPVHTIYNITALPADNQIIFF